MNLPSNKEPPLPNPLLNKYVAEREQAGVVQKLRRAQCFIGWANPLAFANSSNLCPSVLICGFSCIFMDQNCALRAKAIRTW